MSQGFSPPTKNRKTFSGCWSCRERKIKCDEAKPTCRQCMKSGLECKGYGVRLHWITNKRPDVEFPGVNNPRRNIVPDSEREVLSWDRIDEILNKLGQYDPKYRPVLKENVQISMDCFGVFRNLNYAIAASPLQDESTPLDIQIRDIIEAADNTQSRAAQGNVDIALYALNSPTSIDGQEGSPSFGISNFATNSQNQLVQTPCYHRVREDERDALQGSDDSLAAPSSSVYLGRTEKFLMNYYSKRVVDLFCVIQNGTSPWKTIHLPKAQRAVGQITLEGGTSRIREALVSSCLSISAFCLSNDYRLRLQETEAVKWEKLAYDFRLKAIKLLRNAMEADFYPKTRVKYKDFLVTTLSMVTIDVGAIYLFACTTNNHIKQVMSGETDTCGIHLDGALRLIRHGLTWKRQYSNKAQCLHRIYFYLRTIFESTLPRDNQLRRQQLSSPAEQESDSEDVFCHSIVSKYSSWSSPSILDRNSDPNIGSYESIYGIPYSLLFLLTKVIDLISKLYGDSFDGRIPTHLVDECDELEHSIMDWPTNANFPPQPPASYSSNAKIVYYHTVAFHHALIIYFAQHVRLVGHRFLQPHIREVLDSMEVIEKIKVETNLIAAPLYWPAFIASSEAFDKNLQERVRKWYDHVRQYGIEALRTGISVLEEVWEAGPRRGDRVTSSWREVVEKSGLVLMLS